MTHNCIYSFTGCESNAMDLMAESLRKTGKPVVELPLSVTYRCPKSVVTLANTWVPQLEAHPTAPDGIIRSIPLEKEPCYRCGGNAEVQDPKYAASNQVNGHWLPVGYIECPSCKGTGSTPCFWDEASQLGPEDVILCRNNRPIIQLAYDLLRKGIPCQVEGRDFAGSLVKLCQRWKVRELNALENRLVDYKEREAAKWRKKRNEERAAGVEDKVDTVLCLLSAVRSTGKTHVSDLIDRINMMFGDTNGQKPRVLTLSTVHKWKGKENKRVFILGRAQYMPSRWAKQDWELQGENNLLYVAVTRSKGELIDIVV